MSVLMSSFKETEQIVLCDEDFPLGYQNGKHPDDYVETDQPIAPQFIFHHVLGKFNRLWWRVSVQLKNGKYASMSFLMDTGAPKHLYLCDEALQVFKSNDRLRVEEDMDVAYTYLFGRKCSLEPTPGVHKEANIVGLKLLKRFGLELFADEPHFHFKVDIPYLKP